MLDGGFDMQYFARASLAFLIALLMGALPAGQVSAARQSGTTQPPAQPPTTPPATRPPGQTPAQQPPAQQPPAGQQQRPPVIRSGINFVSVDVIVSDKKTGDVVMDLTKDDFDVREDKKPQVVQTF